MTQFDLPLDQLRAFRYVETEPADFAAFSAKALREVRNHGANEFAHPVHVDVRPYNGHERGGVDDRLLFDWCANLWEANDE